MKKIVRLTESDLVNIVKRVINESGEPKAVSCSDLDGKYQHEARNMTQRSYLSSGKGTAVWASRSGVSDPDIRDTKDTYRKYIQEPYDYVQLYNGKYCVTKPKPNEELYGKWIEVTDSKQKSAVWNTLQKHPTPEFLRGA